MTSRIDIKSTEILSDSWAVLKRVTFDYRRADGTWGVLVREVHDHGNSAAVLPIDPARNKVLLVRQFRLPDFLNGHEGWLIEAPAGLLDGDAPGICAMKEAQEETGYRISNLRPAFTAMSSPGALTETTHLFLADYAAAGRIAEGGGLAHEGEDIEIVEMDFDAAFAMIGSGGIIDAKTIMLLQHAALARLG